MEIEDLFRGSISYLSKRRHLKDDLFSDFRMSAIQEEYYTQLAEEDPRFEKAFMHDVTDVFKQYLDERIRVCREVGSQDNANVNLVIFGEQGSGKSTYAIAIYLAYRERHKQMHNREPKLYITFSDPQTLDKFSVAPPYAMIIQDETDKLKGVGSRGVMDQLGNLIKRARFSGISLIKLSPELEEIPGCDYSLLTAGYYKEGFEKYLKTGDPSDCYSRAILLTRSRMKQNKWKPLGYVILSVGNAIKFMKEANYIEMKKKSWEEIRENLGGQSASTSLKKEKLQEYADKLYETAIAAGWSGAKKDLAAYLSLADLPVSTAESKTIVLLAYNRYKKEHEKQDDSNIEEINLESEFSLDMDSVLDEIKRRTKSSTIERDIDIYRSSRDPTITGDMIAKKYGISASRISQIIKRMRGKISQILGERFEKIYEKQLEKEFDRVIHRGGIGEPDFECYDDLGVVFVSVKCYDISRSSYTISYEESRAEITAAQKVVKNGGTARVRLDVFDVNTGKIFKNFLDQNVIDHNVPLSVYRKKTIIIHLDKN